MSERLIKEIEAALNGDMPMRLVKATTPDGRPGRIVSEDDLRKLISARPAPVVDDEMVFAMYMARNRLEQFADEANAGRVQAGGRELKRKIWAAFQEFDALQAALTPETPNVSDADPLAVTAECFSGCEDPHCPYTHPKPSAAKQGMEPVDDLINQLRQRKITRLKKAAGHRDFEPDKLCEAAASALRALQAERDEARKHSGYNNHKWQKAEAQLSTLREKVDKAIREAGRVCYETRHATLGDKVVDVLSDILKQGAE